MAKKNTNMNQTTGSTVERYEIDTLDWSKGSTHNKATLLTAVENTIETVLIKSEGLASKLAQALYIMDTEKLYEEVGFTSTAKWAMENYGLSKASVSESLKVYGRFGTRKGIASEYSSYAYSALIKMAPYTNEELSLMEINPDMSRREIVERISEYKDIKKRLPLLDEDDRSTVEQKKTISGIKEVLSEIDKANAPEPQPEESAKHEEERENFAKEVAEKMDNISHEISESESESESESDSDDSETYRFTRDEIKHELEQVRDLWDENPETAKGILNRMIEAIVE